VPSWMVGVSASVNLPLHHEVQKFSSGTGSPRWSREKGCKTVMMMVVVSYMPVIMLWQCTNTNLHLTVSLVFMESRAVLNILSVFYSAPNSGKITVCIFGRIAEPKISQIRIISTAGSAQPLTQIMRRKVL